jgi:hypothetical protein
MNFVVHEHLRATVDKMSIGRYLQTRSRKGAAAWLDAFDKLVKNLESFPLSYQQAPEAVDAEVDVRQAFFKTRHGRLYRVLFLVNENVVHILRIRGPHQDLVSPDEIL